MTTTLLEAFFFFFIGSTADDKALTFIQVCSGPHSIVAIPTRLRPLERAFVREKWNWVNTSKLCSQGRTAMHAKTFWSECEGHNEVREGRMQKAQLCIQKLLSYADMWASLNTYLFIFYKETQLPTVTLHLQASVWWTRLDSESGTIIKTWRGKQAVQTANSPQTRETLNIDSNHVQDKGAFAESVGRTTSLVRIHHHIIINRVSVAA